MNTILEEYFDEKTQCQSKVLSNEEHQALFSGQKSKDLLKKKINEIVINKVIIDILF